MQSTKERTVRNARANPYGLRHSRGSMVCFHAAIRDFNAARRTVAAVTVARVTARGGNGRTNRPLGKDGRNASKRKCRETIAGG